MRQQKACLDIFALFMRMFDIHAIFVNTVLASLKSHLLRHTRIIHSKSIILNEHSCTKCSFQSFHKNSLKNHIATTHDVNMIKCNECDFTTTHKHYIKRHNDTVHLKIKTYCPHCNSYLDTEKLEAHIKLKHTSFLLCSMCDYKTLGIKNLKEHMKRSHNNERDKQFKCNLCTFEAVQPSI